MALLPYRYLLAFGSNLGNREENLRRGLTLVAAFGDLRRTSDWRTTEPLSSSVHDTRSHGTYVNFVCEFQSDLHPESLYEKIRMVEDCVGHDRGGKWRPRHLDIDILFCVLGTAENFGECVPVAVACRNGLRVPHAEFWLRPFLREMVMCDLAISERSLRRHAPAHASAELERGLEVD